MEHRYIWQGDKLVSEHFGNNTLEFYYDESGRPLAISINGAVYFYVTNLQGDVTAIVSSGGEVKGVYNYDAFGKLISKTDNSIMNVNPLRYRGYYYDSETGFYYLKSRYYDPEICRFINADVFASTGQGFIGCNMFAYCLNNPVNGRDSSGTKSIVEYLDDAINFLMSFFDWIKLQYFRIKAVHQTDFSEDQKVFIATMAAEASTTAQGQPVSSAARQAMANVAMNRVGSREWARYSTVSEICEYTGFDGFGSANYYACMNYLNNRDGSNSMYESIIADVIPVYNGEIPDSTNGSQLYYTPAAMIPAGAVPPWNFSLLEEVVVPGVDTYYEGKFFRYR